MELFIAIMMDFFVATLFTMTMSIVAFFMRNQIRNWLQSFLGIEKVRKINVVSNK